MPSVVRAATGTTLPIVGGLVVSQALTLFTTPVVYLALEQLRAWGLKSARIGARVPGMLVETR
jgi:hypothetical protein